MQKKIELGKNSKVNIKWNVNPIDYTHEAEENIKIKFANKYGISKDNIKVDPKFIVINEDGSVSQYETNISENIQYPEFQQKLFKQFLELKGVTDVNFDEIVAIDNDINTQINYTIYDQTRLYTIKWIKWSNFMSYGENNYFDFRNLSGLVLFMSNPANQGGKTTFCIDLFRFLLFGKVTREDDWVLAKAFNNHLPEATEVTVEGCVCIDGVDYVIKRTLSRPELKKRTDKSKVTQKINYYKLVNEEYISLEDEECENEKSTTETNKVIKEAIGNERDFDLMISIDADNLKGLISLKDAERGRLISRWIGLLPLEEKDKIARNKYNKEILPSLLSSKYNKDEVTNESNELSKSIDEMKVSNIKNEDEKKNLDNEINKLNSDRDNLIESKKKIDNSLLNVDVQTLKQTLEVTKENGKIKRSELEENKKKLKEIGDVDFNENEYKGLQEQQKGMLNELANFRADYKILLNEIDALKKGEYCPTCGAKLKDVDNTQKIKDKQDKLNILSENGKKLKVDEENITKKINDLEEKRTKYNEKVKLQLIISKNEVDIENLLSKYNETNKLLKEINDNKAAIEENNKIDTSINIINANLQEKQKMLQNVNNNILTNNITIANYEKSIKQYNDILEKIKQEEILLRNWQLYLEMIGKDGISKLVIRTVLPLINGELKHLLNGVCDFDVEVIIDNHNDVAFNLIHDGIKSSLGSGSGFEKTVASLALRTVLSKISSFSKPSFVVFDEVLGGVNISNYDAVKTLYDKMVNSYGTILNISHNESIHDWFNKTILIEKKDNISTIKTID